MKDWAQIYGEEIEKTGGYENYLSIKASEKKPLLKKIIKYTGHGGRILEAGCGTGVLSTYLSNLGFKVTAIDVDEKMLKLARKIGKNYPRKPIFEKGDLFVLNYPENFFDVVFSHGVLEHFSDEDIVKILKLELKIAKTTIISIPSDYFRENEKMFGDERFLDINKWKSLIEKTQAHFIEVFSFHYLKGWQKICDTVMHMKPFGPAPYLSFVLQKKSTPN